MEEKAYDLKRAKWTDKELLHEWVNDPQVRESAFNSHSIAKEEHEAWLREKLESDKCDLYIYYKDRQPIGQIRLDYEGNKAVIDYSIDRKYRGQGHGRRMLLLAEEKIAQERKEIEYFEAEVKCENVASKRKFEQLGYQSMDIVKYKKRIPAVAKSFHDPSTPPGV